MQFPIVVFYNIGLSISMTNEIISSVFELCVRREGGLYLISQYFAV